MCVVKWQNVIPCFHRILVQISFRPCSVVRDWSPGLIPSRITSLIYIDFDELK
jgi:hypothetical protein